MTLKFWRTTCFKPALVVLLLSGLAGFAWSQDKSSNDYSSSDYSSDYTTQAATHHNSLPKAKSLDVKSVAPAKGEVKDPAATAQKILSNGEYTDSGDLRSRNWFTKAFENVARAIADWLANMFQRQTPTGGSTLLGPAVQYFVWGVIILAIGAFLYFAFKNFAWGKSGRFRRRSVGGLLDQDEPDRTADEWLQRADELSAKGEYRQAVRCLYLACLVRIDEANIARFVRAETNWEHLRRIEISPRRPAGLDFRPTTQKFDEIWYGYKVKGESDVQDFRTFYVDLMSIIGASKAA